MGILITLLAAILDQESAGSPPPSYTPSLVFSDARNSQYAAVVAF